MREENIIKDKRGLIPLFLLVIGVIVAVVLLGLFVFSNKWKYILIGVGLVIAAIFILGKGATNPKGINKNVMVFILLFLGVGILFFILGSGVLQSVISLSSVNVGADGKVFWLLSGTANNIDEGYQFNYQPSTYTKVDGTQIKPQIPLTLYISKSNSYCDYTLSTITYKRFLFPDYSYQVLSNPLRVANMNIKDGKGVTTTLDATLIQTKVLNDPDGSGKVTVQTQGVISSNKDCAESSDIAVIEHDGQHKIVSKSQLEIKLSTDSGVLTGTSMFKLSENTQFTSWFNTYPTLTSNDIKGNIDIGNGLFTITADQDYFNSVVFLPPKQVNPNVLSINIPSSIQKGSSTGMSVDIKNENTAEGTAVIKITSSQLSISPSSTNFILKSGERKTLYFTITAQNVVSSYTINAEICSTGQFDTPICDKETKTGQITTTPSITECGDNICQSNENDAVCPVDCKIENIPIPIIESKTACEQKAQNNKLLGYQWIETNTREGKGPLGIGGLIGLYDYKTSGECKATFLIYYVLGGIILIFGGAIFYIMFSKVKRRKR